MDQQQQQQQITTTTTASTIYSNNTIVSSKNNDFLTLHKAYIDEWLTVSFLPILKTAYDGENNFYDISNLNLKNVNQRNIPFSEQLFALDRQFMNLINQWEKLSRTDSQRATKIETYQQSFYTFIDRIKSTLEKTMVDLGGSLEDSSFLAAAISLKENNSKNKRLTIMARSRITNTSPGSTNSYQHQMHLTGPISIVWNEILIIISRKVSEEISRLQSIENGSGGSNSGIYYQFNNNNLINQVEIYNFRQNLYSNSLSTITPLLFEWRIMMANAQKVLSEEKRFKTNPFIATPYDYNSSSYISAPILISTTNKVASALSQNNYTSTSNLTPTSSSSTSPSSPTLTHQNHNQSFNNNNNEDNLISTSPPTNNNPPNSTIVSSPISWTKAVKRPSGMNSSGGNIPILNNSNSVNNNGGNILNNSSNSSSNNSNSSNNNINNNKIQNQQQINQENVNSENIPTGGIIKQGWMKKRGTKNKSWKKRYFILDMKKTLRYYKEKPVYNNNNNSNSNNGNTNNGNNNNNNNGSPILNGNNISLPIGNNNPHFSIASNGGNINNNSSSINNGSTSTSTNNLIDESILTNFDSLKYKGSIDLYTSLVVAIKPSTCNININNNGFGGKEDNNSYFGMDIITPKRTWNLCCVSSKSMDDWLLVLKSANK